MADMEEVAAKTEAKARKLLVRKNFYIFGIGFAAIVACVALFFLKDRLSLNFHSSCHPESTYCHDLQERYARENPGSDAQISCVSSVCPFY